MYIVVRACQVDYAHVAALEPEASLHHPAARRLDMIRVGSKVRYWSKPHSK